ncbi:polysaccharide biosynthesis protein [Gracilibacillus sp. YIM 98692]|uniref:putative polysaccharide biosynthesis protein n=1 Tax=Gracilibacillus sp. YIM 98692 TaxID=2663532 RepID=UPI0013D83BBD|nr:polysaccharide biosynthesis protein [Gracilibacillus sp. YIM 98692]
MNAPLEKKYIYKGAFSLVIAGLISKVISAFYRIPLQNLTGDLGFYIYQQIYPILGIAFMFALYGFPAALSKVMAERKADQYHLALYQKLFFTLMLFCAIAFILIFNLSPWLAQWMGDVKLETPIRYSAFVFLCIPFVAILRGALQAQSEMQVTAHSQMIEQLIRAAVIIWTAYWIYREKLVHHDIAVGAVAASLSAFTMSFLYLYVQWKKRLTIERQPVKLDVWFLIRSVILPGLIISMNHMLLLFMQLADAFTIVPGLHAKGMPLKEAMKWKGVFDRGQPLLQLVTIVGSSFALALIPQATKIQWQTNRQETLEKVRSLNKYCFILSVGAVAGLVILFPEINQLLFKNSLGSNSLRILSISLLFSSLVLTIASILQGIGYIKWTALVLVIGLLVKLILNSFLVPWLGISGSAMATTVAIFIIYLLNVYQLKKVMKGERVFQIPWRAISLSTIMMTIGLIIIKYINTILRLETRIELFFLVMVSVLIGFTLYLLGLFWFKAFTKAEIENIPILHKLQKSKRWL